MLRPRFRHHFWGVPVRCYFTNKLPQPPHVLFFGRDQFSCKTLQVLHSAPEVWGTISVVTSPDKVVGRRGRKEISEAPIKEVAKSLNLPLFFIPPSTVEFSTWQPQEPFATPSPANIILTASFGHAIPSSVLSLFEPANRLNVHASLLPLYRGAAPIQRAIADGKQETGVTIVEMTHVSDDGRGFDVGRVWGQVPVAIPPGANYDLMEDTLAYQGGRLLVDLLRRRLVSDMRATEQNDARATYAYKIKLGTARVDWNTWTADKASRMHRAFSHQRPLHTRILKSGKRVALLDVQSTPTPDSESAPHKMLPELRYPGDASLDLSQTRTSYDNNNQRGSILIRCADGSYVRVYRLQTENRDAVDARAWWNGIRPEFLSDGVLKLGRIDGRD